MAKMKDFGQRMRFLGFSIVLNSGANALTISTNLGSAVWTGSSVNLANWIHVPLGDHTVRVRHRDHGAQPIFSRTLRPATFRVEPTIYRAL